MNTFPAVRETENFLSLDLTPNYQALLSTQQLIEVIHLTPADIIPIPQMPSAVVGVFPWQGEVLWLVDLSYWMGFEPLLTLEFVQSRCSILKIKSQGSHWGFLIYQVGQLISCDLSKIRPSLPSTFSLIPTLKTRLDCFKGTWIDSQGNSLLVLDSEAIGQHLIQHAA